MWDLFLMKKLIKNKICGSMNSAYMHDSLQKVNICGYCSLNSNRNTPKCVKTKKKKKRTKRSLETQTWNPNTHEFPKKKRLWWHNANKKQNPQNTIFGLLNFSPYILIAINFGPFYFQLSIHFRRKMFVHSLNFGQVAKIHVNFYIGQFTA